MSRTTFSKQLSQPTIFQSSEKDLNIGIDLLVANDTFLAAYPLHEVNSLNKYLNFNFLKVFFKGYGDEDLNKSDRKVE